jgi:hypothetical protein
MRNSGIVLAICFLLVGCADPWVEAFNAEFVRYNEGFHERLRQNPPTMMPPPMQEVTQTDCSFSFGQMNCVNW